MLTIFSAAAMTLNADLELGAQVTLIGMGTVFVALIIIWGVLAASGAIFSRRKKSGAQKPAPAAAPAPAKAAPAAPAPAAVQNDSGELVAVLAAAVAAASGMSRSDFRVVSFRRR